MDQSDLHPESRDLSPTLDEDERDEIGTELCDHIKTDDESRAEWKERHAEWRRLYYQTDVAKNPPWEGSSSESVPMLAEACNQFHARAYQNLFPHRNIVTAIPVGKVDAAAKERSERIGTHMSWQLTVKDKGYKRNKDRLLLGLPLDGCYFTKAYYSPVKKRNVVENVRALDLIVPYGIGPRELEDIDRKTQVLYYSMNKCRILENLGYFSELPEPYEFDDENPVDKAEDEAHGLERTGFDGQDIAKLYECHTIWDLDGDGIAEPYIVTICAQSQKVLRLAIRYDTDEAGNPTEDKLPVEHFTAYHYLENPNGFYGLGHGHLIGKMNSAVNKLLRQTIDAATLANAGNMSGFVSQQLGGIQGQQLKIALGQFIKIPGSTDDIQKGIFQFKFPGPQPALMDALALLMQRSDRLATVTEALTGQTDKVMQPTTVMALIEQGLELFSAVYARVIESWSMELEKLYRLNHKYMDPEEYFSVLDITGDYKQFSVSREDYAADFQVMPIADPKNTSEQKKLAKAEAEWAFLAQNPLVMNSPLHLYNASRRYLTAIESENLDEVLPNPAKDVVPRIDDPQAENALILSPEPMIPMAYPEQDHLMHLETHMGLLKDPEYAHLLSEQGILKLQEHIKAHAMMLYGQTERGQGPINPVVLPGNDPMGAQAGGPAVPPELAGPGPADGGQVNGAGPGAGVPVEDTGVL